MKARELLRQTVRGNPVVQRMPPEIERGEEPNMPTGAASTDLMPLLDDGQRIVDGPYEMVTRQKNPRPRKVAQ